MTQQILIAGGGIGGMSAALACARAGWEVRLFERSAEFREFGAGIQLSPNVTKILHGWGLAAALEAVAAFPQQLQVRDASSGKELGHLPLGERARQKYGAPYATIHRADLLRLLIEAAQSQGGAPVHLNGGTAIERFTDAGQAVTVRLDDGLDIEGDLLVGADGLWSRVRGQLLGDGPPRVTGHLAYRALVPQSALAERMRSQQVTAWLGPRLHLVAYPVRGGEWLNVVAIVQGRLDPRAQGGLQDWDHATHAAELENALSMTAAPLRELVDAVTAHGAGHGPGWRLWALCDRPPMARANQQARGLVALLGDAAHPMRPYLAQGAGMAIEDADELSRALAMKDVEIALRVRRYALNRWSRCARVQAQSIRNGVIFHAQGALRWGRDASMRLLGERLLDVPWLYRGT